MLKVGDKVKVIGNTSEHEFNIGEIVECVKLEEDGIHEFKCKKDSSWYMTNEDYEILPNVEEEIGYTTITAVHFGNHGEYTWQCDRDLFKDIKLLDLVLVDTVKGEQIVQVVKKSETIDIKGIHKKVIKKLEVY